MRRFTLSVLLALFTIAGMAAELNIYASGLRLHGASPVTGENQVHIDYFLNAPATDLKFVVLDATTGAEKTSVTIPAGDANANYAKGSHTDVVVDLSSFFGAGDTYKWAIKATAEATGETAPVKIKTVGNSTAYGRALTIDNSYESPYYGNIYAVHGRGVGIYGFDAALNQLFDGNAVATNGWTSSSNSSPFSATVGENGLVFIADYSDTNPNVRIFNPANPSVETKAVFGGTAKGSDGIMVNGDGDTIHGSIRYCYPKGSGENTVLYTADEDYLPGNVTHIFKYNIGNAETPWNAKPSGNGITHSMTNGKWANTVSNLTFVPSKIEGGWWISQHRYSDASSVPVLMHLADGALNYNSTGAFANSTVGYNNQGTFAVNNEQSILVTATNNTKFNLLVWDVSWTGKVPTVTAKYTISSGLTASTFGIAIDDAGNIYACSPNKPVTVWALPKAENSCTTPAASSRTIVLESYIPLVHVTGVELDETAKTVKVGDEFTLTATVSPDNAADPSYSWSTSNSNVASVVNGVVTAKAVGTADITVTTTDGGFTATCAVTVEPQDPLAGNYNIGGDAPDFASLYEAFQYAEDWGISADVTFLICADLNENHNVGITNNTAYTIAVRPNAAVKRTIQYGSQADNAGPSGHIVIGATNAIGFNTTIPTRNILIDGSYNDEGQYLEFRAGTVGGRTIVLYGDVTNTVIKNCRIINPRTGNTTNYAIDIRTQRNTDNKPAGIGFVNCYIQATGTANTQAIQFNGSESTSAAGKPTDCYFRGCEITAKLRCVFFNGANSATFEGNTFRFTAASAGFLAHALMGNAQAGTIVVRGNKFIEMSTTNASAGAYGIQSITAAGGATKWIIENNYFAGMNATAAAATDKDFALTYIRCSDPCEIRHNTFYMPSLTKKPATAITSANPITCVYLANAVTHTVENNIFVSAETSANNSLIRGSLNENVKNNVFFHNGGNAYIVAGAASKQDWAAFTQGGANAGSAWVQPTFANAANGNLALTVSNDDMKMARLEEVLKDINGTDRAASTYAGAYELQDVAVTAVTIDQASLILAPGDNTKTLTATVEPANTTYNKLTWASDNAAVIVNATTGAITAVSVGTAHITATIGGITSAPITVEVANPVAHVLPYNLNRVLNNDKNSYTFSFKSNIAATSGKLVFYQGGVYQGEVAITDPIVAGENSVYVAKTSLPQIDGEMTWAVELSAAESKVIGELTNPAADIYNHYCPQGLAVDNSPESPYFGNIYITEPWNGATDGQTDRTKTQQAGLFVYDLQLNELNPTNQGYQLGLTLPAATRHGFKRVNVDAQGNVYVNSNEAIYKANPADFTTSTTLAANKFTAINSFCIDGDIFYVMDNGTALKKLEAGNVTEIATETSHLVSSNATDNNIVQDGHGGWWILESRANADTYYSLFHVNAAKEIDFKINQNNNQAILADCNPKSTRGGLALNSDKTILAMGSNSTVIFFDLAYDSNGTPTITRKPWTLPTLGYNIDGVAFDYADNLYVVSASTERFYAYSLPKADNTTLVPAKSTLTVDAQQHIAVTSITLSQTSASLEIGETLDLTATCLPDEATSKTVEWSSDNTSVAEVNPTTGRVTAVSVGTAHIMATSTVDGVISETCEIAVYKLDFTVTWETNGASYTTTQLSSNSDLWSQFMTGYNTYYVAKGKSARAIQPMTAVATFAWWGVIDLLTDPVSLWKWLGDYMLATADAQSVTLTTESEWTTALQDFFSCTAVKVNFAEAGQVAAWLPLWKNANNYLPATMRATDAMPTIQYGNNTFMGWYDNAQFSGSPVTSVTQDTTLYAKWYAPVVLDELATDNAATIAENNGRTLNVIFNRRFEVAEGWYTLILPFDLSADEMEAAFGAGYRLMELEDAYKKSETMLYVRFGEAYALEAGKPYLFQTGMDITEDIVFSGVTIDNSGTLEVDADEIKMIGLYDKTDINPSPLDFYLGQGNYLYEYLTTKTTKGFRAFFRFKNEQLASMVVARVIFRDDVTTDLEDETFETAPAVQKIIRNGQLIIIRDGIEYNAQGQVIK